MSDLSGDEARAWGAFVIFSQTDAVITLPGLLEDKAGLTLVCKTLNEVMLAIAPGHTVKMELGTARMYVHYASMSHRHKHAISDVLRKLIGPDVRGILEPSPQYAKIYRLVDWALSPE